MMNFIKSRGFIYILAIGVGLAAFLAGQSLNDKKQATPVDLMRLKDGAVTQSVGQPVIGGPFALTDHNGKAVTEKDYLGKYLMVYFGYTYCPDVCPTSMQTILDAMDMVGDGAEKIVPMMITIDPERDTPEVLKEFVTQFHPRMVGLTGSADAIASAVRGYRVYRAKVEDESVKGKDEDYLMDHTSITYFMGPDGKFIKHFPHGTPVDKMAERIKSLM